MLYTRRRNPSNRQKQRSSKRRKRLTTRQRVLIGVAMASCAAPIVTYVLAACGRDACETVTCAVIAMFGTAFSSYMICDTADHNSANKYGIDLQVLQDRASEVADGSD